MTTSARLAGAMMAAATIWLAFLLADWSDYLSRLDSVQFSIFFTPQQRQALDTIHSALLQKSCAAGALLLIGMLLAVVESDEDADVDAAG